MCSGHDTRNIYLRINKIHQHSQVYTTSCVRWYFTSCTVRIYMAFETGDGVGVGWVEGMLCGCGGGGY